MEEGKRFSKDEEIELKEIVGIILRKKMLIILITGIFTVMALFLSLLMYNRDVSVTKYTASAEVKVEENPDFEGQLSAAGALGKSYVILEVVKNQFGMTMDVKDMADGLTVLTKSDTSTIEILFEATEKLRAVKLADAIANQVVAFVENSMDVESVYVTRRATTMEEPIQIKQSINLVFNTALGFMLGLMISISLVLFLAYLKNRAQMVAQLENRLGIRVIGVIPKYDANETKGGSTLVEKA